MIASSDVHLQTVQLSIGVGRIFVFQRRRQLSGTAGLTLGALLLAQALVHTHFGHLKRNLLINTSLFMFLTTMASADDRSKGTKLEYLI